MMSVSAKENEKKKYIAYNISVDEKKNSLLFKNYISHLFCTACFYTKQGLSSQQIFNVNVLDECFQTIHKCKMAVFRVNGYNKKTVLDRLLDFCNVFGCYGPIVEVKDNDIYFFPRLNYGDVYLIKDMFQRKFVNEKINVIIGGIAI